MAGAAKSLHASAKSTYLQSYVLEPLLLAVLVVSGAGVTSRWPS
jgi:hypothetical protein